MCQLEVFELCKYFESLGNQRISENSIATNIGKRFLFTIFSKSKAKNKT